MGDLLTDIYLSEPALRLVIAVFIGGAIGFDRAYRGRAAGFRTHILVCLASTVLMLMMDFPWLGIHTDYTELVRVDPTRMAQGIMTGIGFLGAGVIMQDKQSVRGLTTAASIWVTAAIGIMIGAGFYSAAFAAAILTLITLAVFNRLIDVLPIRHYALLVMSFKRHECLSEDEVRQLLKQQKTVISNLTYKLDDDGNVMTYRMTVRSTHRDYIRNIAQQCLKLDHLQGFTLQPLGD
ncbi:MgtC/SapB family protein [Maricurvus nonylphenolicus]|uniref:MgtC/SapB family protein n=1 Tax=Maricurvus nonylphenolicus TaxID=1008307 RepID=UPI0036F1E45F